VPETLEAVGELFTGSNDGFESPPAKLALFGALVLAAVGLVGILRRLPLAYGAYFFVALIPPLSSPWPEHPLMSFPRFLAVLFPLFMWLAVVSEKRGWTMQVSSAFAVGLGLFTAQFAAWEWIA